MTERRWAVATIVAKNYVSFARVLAASFRRFHPDVPVFVLLTDEVEGYFDPAAERFDLIPMADLGVPQPAHLRFRYDRKQLAVATKPFLLGHLLDQGFDTVLFLDPDILVLNDLGHLLSGASGHAVTLVPHLLAPLAGEDRVARELNILQSGTFNAGCLGVTGAPSARRFVDWWQCRVLEHCRHDVAAGVYFDQRWLDLVPVFFDDVFIVRDPSYNVAHWNLPERPIGVSGDGIVVDGRPCRFVHFSGFDPDRPHAVTRYSPRLHMDNVGSAAEVFRRYVTLLHEAGYADTKSWPYAFDRFDNGVAVTDRMRRLHAGMGPAAERFGDPLATSGSDSFFQWLRRSGERA